MLSNDKRVKEILGNLIMVYCFAFENFIQNSIIPPQHKVSSKSLQSLKKFQ